MPDLQRRYIQDPSIVYRQIAGEAILVPIRQNVGDLESIYTLNETAAFAWSLLDGEHSLAQVRDAVVTEFQVTPNVAKTDLLEFISQLVSIDAIQPVDA